MADDSKTGNFTNYSIIFTALISGGALFFNHFAPLQDSRPQTREPLVHETVSAQDVDARLWQDPFAVVAQAVKEAKERKAQAECPDPPAPSGDRHCLPPVTQMRQSRDLAGDEANPLILGVAVTGAPYAEDVEERRRKRYAVVSGLDAQGYVPASARHIGYFRLPQSSDRPLPATIPFELFEARSAAAPAQKILVLWLNEDMAARRPLLHFCRLLNLVDPGGQGMQVLGPHSSDTLRDLVKEVKDSSETGDAASQDCLRASSGLERSNFYAYGATVEDRAVLSGLGIADFASIHGFLESKRIHLFRTVATDDSVARALVRELKLRGVEPGVKQRGGAGQPVAQAALSGEQHIALISEWDSFYGQTFPATMQNCFAKGDGLDDANASCSSTPSDPPWVHRFTYLRGLDGATPQSQGDAKKPDGDTAKGPGKDLDAKASDLPFGEGQFDYLRRLADDIKTLQDELKHADQGRIVAIGVLGTDVFDKLLVLRALKPQFPDAVFFTTDFDAALTMESERSWTRNLVIASSFGPSLSRSLQGAIPPFRESYQTAAFLSTQLAVIDARRPPKSLRDAAPSDDKVSQAGSANVLTGRSVADPPQIAERLQVGDRLQASERQQTSGQLQIVEWLQVAKPAAATVPHDPRPSSWPADDEQSRMSQWLANPPTFEIERSGDVLPLPRRAVLAQADRAGNEDCKTNLQRCADIQPPSGDLYPPVDLWVRLIIAVFLGLAFSLALFKANRYRLALQAAQRASHRGQSPLRLTFADFASWSFTLLLALFAQLGVILLVVCLAWPLVAGWLTENGDGEPMKLLEGVSLWPSIVLRLVTFVLSLSLIFFAWARLERNLQDLARTMKMRASPRTMIRAYNQATQNLRFYEKIYRCFRIGLPQGRRAIFDIETAWENYIVQGRPFARFCRVSACVVIMMIVLPVLFSVFGAPLGPGRSGLARFLYNALTLADVVLMFFLIFFVVDATLFCFLFVRRLAYGATLWPAKTKSVFAARLGLDRSTPSMAAQHGVLDDWIDLYFISKRTACINTLIYYPFAVIALMIVSRSAVFSDFPLSQPILITQALSLLVVIGCAIALNRVAEDARAIAKRHLSDEVIKAKGSPDSGRAGQWESLLSRVSNLQEGAFRPFLQQPIIGAVMLPLSSVGWTTVLEKGLLGL